MERTETENTLACDILKFVKEHKDSFTTRWMDNYKMEDSILEPKTKVHLMVEDGTIIYPFVIKLTETEKAEILPIIAEIKDRDSQFLVSNFSKYLSDKIN